MRSPRWEVRWLAAVIGLLWTTAAALAQSAPAAAAVPPPLDQLAPAFRSRVQRVVEQPTLTARAPAEAFFGQPNTYQWLLEHPDRVCNAWCRLGTPCLQITDRGNGRFGWADDQGSDLYWDTVLETPEMRVWYAEGQARASVLLPPVPIRAVLVLRYWQTTDETGRVRLHHQADLFLKMDSKTATLATRLMGPSAPRMAEQCVVQLQFFFSAVTRYIDRHPERADALLAARPRANGG